jgi:outer membrane protein assembly factor BamB
MIITAALISGALLLTSCTGAISRGWAGGAVANGNLYLASMKGRIIVVRASDNTVLGTPVQIDIPASGGLSCLPSSCSSSSSPLVIYSSPTVLDQVVYVGGYGTSGGKVYAYRFKEGALLPEPDWTYPKENYLSGNIIGGLTLFNNNIYFATSNGYVYSLSADALQLNWSHKIDSKIWAAPTVNGDTLYIGCFNKNVYALNLSDGSEKWQTKTAGSINSSPVVLNNTIYIGDYSRHFYAMDAATGNIKWDFPTDDTAAGSPANWFWASPVILNNVIYAANLDGNVYCLDASSGKLLNTYILGDTISSSPIIVGNYLVVSTAVGSTDPKKQRGKVYIINTTDGSKREADLPSMEDVNAPLFADGSVVYLHTTKDNLFSIDTAANNSQITLLFNLSTVK